MKNNAQDLEALTIALDLAKRNDFIKTQHAKDVFMKALEESGFNTPKPELRRVIASVSETTKPTLPTVPTV